MRARILTSALEDLVRGRAFYEKQGEGLGDYFFDSDLPTLIRWPSTAEFTGKSSAATGCSPAVFPTRFTTKWTTRVRLCEEESPFTQWSCGNCGYGAEEDEAQASECPRCSSPKMSALLKDSDGFHRWCCVCGSFQSTKEAFAI